MESHNHSLSVLFEQLGLDSSEEDIENFINNNKPIPDNILLHEADFWSASQSDFLKQMIEEDADWAECVDQLNLMLR